MLLNCNSINLAWLYRLCLFSGYNLFLVFVVVVVFVIVNFFYCCLIVLRKYTMTTNNDKVACMSKILYNREKERERQSIRGMCECLHVIVDEVVCVLVWLV